MTTVIVHQFKVYHVAEGQFRVSGEMATREAIYRVRGEIVPGTALRIHRRELDIAEEGITPLGFVATNRMVEAMLSKLGVSSSAQGGDGLASA